MADTGIDEPASAVIARSRRLASMMAGDVFIITFKPDGHTGARNLVDLVETDQISMPNGELIDLKVAADERRWGNSRRFTILATGRFRKDLFDKHVRPFLEGPLRLPGSPSRSRDAASKRA